MFAQRVLDDLLYRVRELPVLDDAPHRDVLSITEACQRHGGRTEELTREVLDQQVEAFRLPGDARLHAVRVSVSCLVAARELGRPVADRQ